MAWLIHVNPADYHVASDDLAKIGCEKMELPSLSAIEEMEFKFPCVIVIHFDPVEPGLLDHIRELKEQLPSIPVIMTDTEYRDKVALWALRSRMWDYVIVPGENEYLLSSISHLLSTMKRSGGQKRDIVFPEAKEGQLSSDIVLRDRTHRARSYIEGHFREKIRVEDLADLCQMSISSFLRHFKKEHGLTMREMVKDCRIQEARKLLCTSNLSVKKIAFDAGYGDVSHFNRLFKSVEGMTPVEYRIKYQHTVGA